VKNQNGGFVRFTIKYVNEESFGIFLDSVDRKLRAKILASLENVESIGLFLSVDHLEGEINEFRVRHGSNIARILWAYERDRKKVIIITHGFIKKTQKTPRSEIEKAKKLLNEFRNRKE
jgi:phage-related protein